MPILVVCPGCRKSFQVSDKFAGKSGPCPKCKTTIQVPEKSLEVKVHVPEAFSSGGRSAKGKLITRPIARAVMRLRPVPLAIGIAVTVAVVMATWLLGRTGLFQQSLVMCAVGLLAVSPPLVLGGYGFLRDDELEPYRHRELYLRASACAGAYVVLWAAFGYFARPLLATGEPWNWLIVAPPMLIAGSLAAMGSLDLDAGNGFFHYVFYLVVTILLRALAGLGWIWLVK